MLDHSVQIYSFWQAARDKAAKLATKQQHKADDDAYDADRMKESDDEVGEAGDE